MIKNNGVTLTELLIAMVIFASIFALSSQGIIQSLQGQRIQEASSSSQAKLRRVSEVVTQEIRGSILGGITNTPYQSDSDSVSFFVLDGGAGFQVTNTTATSTAIVANTTDKNSLDLSTGQALIMNRNGDAVLVNITGIQNAADTYSFQISHGSCPSALPLTNDSVLFKVRTIGYEYDSNSKTLFRKKGTANAQAVAFNIAEFELDYVYQVAGAQGVSQDLPAYDSSNRPLKRITATNAVLTSLNLVLATEENQGSGKSSQRAFASQVNLINNATQNEIRSIGGVQVCN